MPVLAVLLLSAYQCAGQSNHFDRIEPKLSNWKTQDAIDSILAVPYHEMVSDFDKSLFMMQKAYIWSGEINYPIGKGKSAHQLSIVHYLKGQYDSSAFYNIKAQEIFEAAKLPIELGNVVCSYGYSIKRRNLPEAFKLMRKGIRVLEKEKSQGSLTSAYDNFGVLHEMNDNLDSATFYYSKALSLKENLADSIGIPYSLNNLGGVMAMRGDYEGALPYFERALHIRENLNDDFGVAESQSLFGDLYLQWDKFTEAIGWFQQSNIGCSQLNYPFLKQHNLEQLSTCFEKTGRNDLALLTLRESDAIGDSLLNEKNLKQINELEQKFKSAEKDKSIAQLEEKNLRRQRYLLIIAGLLVLVGFSALLYIQIQKRKARAQRDKAIIEERERGLDAVFQATEDERRRIAKDLHDGISQQLSGLRLSFESLSIDLSTKAPEQAQRIEKLNSVLDETCNEVRSISHQMMPKALSETGLLAAIDDMLSKSLGLTPIQFRLEHFKVEGKRFNEKVELGVFRVCQELVNNIMKHSGATEVVVQLFLSKNNLVMIVEDNGKGFGESSKRDGIGLTNITSRINTVDGEVTWEPGPQQGTVATVRVPLGAE
ncbi:MAG: tetratricopeptide repeat protein [Flavobacteriales bacterium]